MNARTAAKFFLSLTVCLLTPHLGTAQRFTGSNAPGGATNFSFSVPASATNLSLTLPGSATA